VPRYSLRSVLDWLHAGYPEGIPPKDHFALLSVLRRRLTDEDIGRILDLSVATAHEHPERHVDYDTLRRIIAGVLQEDPSQEDIDRVTEHLVAGGWPVVATDDPDENTGGDENTDPDENTGVDGDSDDGSR